MKFISGGLEFGEEHLGLAQGSARGLEKVKDGFRKTIKGKPWMSLKA